MERAPFQFYYYNGMPVIRNDHGYGTWPQDAGYHYAQEIRQQAYNDNDHAPNNAQIVEEEAERKAFTDSIQWGTGEDPRTGESKDTRIAKWANDVADSLCPRPRRPPKNKYDGQYKEDTLTSKQTVSAWETSMSCGPTLSEIRAAQRKNQAAQKSKDKKSQSQNESKEKIQHDQKRKSHQSHAHRGHLKPIYCEDPEF